MDWIEWMWMWKVESGKWLVESGAVPDLTLETIKTITTPRKINAILLNIKINRPKLVNMCGYTLATKWQNFTEIYLA